jgi:excisionase family DNA binding protein
VSERLLTAGEVAELLAVPESWVREATREGRLPHLCLGRYRRYERAAIERWLTEQRGGPTTREPTRLASRPGNELGMTEQ